jgi:hypothetical protein
MVTGAPVSWAALNTSTATRSSASAMRMVASVPARLRQAVLQHVLTRCQLSCGFSTAWPDSSCGFVRRRRALIQSKATPPTMIATIARLTYRCLSVSTASKIRSAPTRTMKQYWTIRCLRTDCSWVWPLRRATIIEPAPIINPPATAAITSAYTVIRTR